MHLSYVPQMSLSKQLDIFLCMRAESAYVLLQHCILDDAVCMAKCAIAEREKPYGVLNGASSMRNNLSTHKARASVRRGEICI